MTDALQNSQVTADLQEKCLLIMSEYLNGMAMVKWVWNGPIANAGPDIFQLDEDKDGKELVYLDGSSSTHITEKLVHLNGRLMEMLSAQISLSTERRGSISQP